MSTAGTTVPLNYGYVWGTGIKLQSRTLENTGDHNLDWTRVGFYLLQEGEMDGLVEMYDTGTQRVLAQNESDNQTWLHFHSGSDATVAGGTAALSIGGDQGVDNIFQYLPSGLMPLNYNRWAYYAFKLKQVALNIDNPDQENPDHWVDTQPIGLWRGTRCRIFDAAGVMTGYGFTRNPAWHYVDLICRRKLFREFLIDQWNGAEDLPSAAKACFDFAALADSAAFYEQVDANNIPLFAGDYSFTQRTTLQACISQVLTCSRSYQRERAGKYSIVPDRPRTSVFTFTRKNAELVGPSDSDLHSNASLYTGKFRDLMAPAFATIQSISMDGQTPVVTTQAPHSAVADDYIIIGATGTAFDRNWQVDSVPDTNGAPVYSMRLKSRGSNYPAAIGAGGVMGFRFSRFKDRSPQFQHKAFQRALGAVGVGLPRQRNRRNKDTDFATCSWDQVARVSKYQRAVELGSDVAPYIAPSNLTIKAPLFAVDAAGSGAVAIQLEPADVVTIDSTLSDAYQGLYEVVKDTANLTSSESTGGGRGTPSVGGLELQLRPYSASNYPNANDGTEGPGWTTVPVLPGDQPDATYIPLASGEAVFFTGQAGSGESFQLPDGFTKENMICWGAPAGFVEGNAHLHYIEDCDAYWNAKLQLLYNDGSGSQWTGDLNYCGVAWRTQTSASLFSIGPMDYVELTLAGGEKIVFGKGQVQSGTQVNTPADYEVNKLIPMAFPKNIGESGKPTHGFASYISKAGNLHFKQVWVDIWEGLGNAMIFGAKNNLGTWRSHPNGWMHCPLPDGRVLAVNGVSLWRDQPNAIYADDGFLPHYAGAPGTGPEGVVIPPLAGVPSTTLRYMPTPDGCDFLGDHAAHGVKDCHIDSTTLRSTTTFADGEGNEWYGSNAVFSLLCDKPTSAMGGDVIPADATRWPGPASSGSTGGSGGSGGDAGDGGSGKPFPGRPITVLQPAG